MNVTRTLDYLADIEQAAEDILADKRQLVDLDKQRQKLRQASRELYKDKAAEKAWLCVGNMFIQFPKQRASHILDEDFRRIDCELSDIRQRLKVKVNKLQDLEHKEQLKGFNLSPLSQTELNAIKQLL